VRYARCFEWAREDRHVSDAKAVDGQIRALEIPAGLEEVVEPELLNPIDIHDSAPRRRQMIQEYLK
jgi:hypothetical protein